MITNKFDYKELSRRQLSKIIKDYVNSKEKS